MNVTTLKKEDTRTHILEELKKMRNVAVSNGYQSLAFELSHMIADKTSEEVEKGNIETSPFTSTADLLK
jgi:hypothetical protein